MWGGESCLCSLPSLFTSSESGGSRPGQVTPHPAIFTRLNPESEPGHAMWRVEHFAALTAATPPGSEVPSAVWKQPDLGLIPGYTPPLSPGGLQHCLLSRMSPGSAGSLLGSWRHLARRRGGPIPPILDRVRAPAPGSEAFPLKVLISPAVWRGSSRSPECECGKLAKEEVKAV